MFCLFVCLFFFCFWRGGGLITGMLWYLGEGVATEGEVIIGILRYFLVRTFVMSSNSFCSLRYQRGPTRQS